MTLVSDHHFPRHSHDQYGIGVIEFGAHRSWSGTGAVEASAGDVIMVNPGEMHDGRGERGWRMIYLDPSVVAGLVDDEINGDVEMVRPVAKDPLLAASFARLFACLTDDRMEVEENLLRSVMDIVWRHAIPRPAPVRSYRRSIRKALERLDAADPDEAVSLAELAALAGMSRFQLLRGFAREVGITPHAYLIQKRVGVARRLLAGGETSAQAAARAGFADQSHMTRAFVRQLGVTPARYRAAVAR
jgi:AraC-like DNA-binding protein